MRFLVVLLAGLLWAGAAHPQGYQCRTSPVGASTAYCASEAFVTESLAGGVQGPASAVSGDVAVFDGTTGKLIKDGGALPVIGAGIDQNILNSQSGNYSIATTDCGKTVSWTGTPGTLTLPAVSGFDGKCSVRVCNANQNDNLHHAAILSGFPAPSLGRLWMQQCESVAINNGAWIVTVWPGKWRPGFVPTLFVDNGGSDNNDGLVSNAAANALANPQACWTIFQKEWDLSQIQPVCSPTGGQTFTGGVNCSLVGSTSVYFLVGNGGQAKIQNTAGNIAIQENDFCGYIIADNINADCTNAASHPCFAWFIHQQNGTDLSTGGHTNGVTLTGANSTDVAFECDSVCKVNSGAVVTLAGTLAQGFVFNLGSMLNITNGVSTAASTGIGANVFQIFSGSQLVYSGALTAGASTTVSQIFDVQGNGSEVCIGTFSTSGTFTGARQWAVLNQGVLLNQSSNAIPGSAGVNSAAGFLNGAVIGTSASGC